jgi:hypothetical protein
VILAAPVLFAIVFELMRVNITGPTVDRPQLTTYGIYAVVVGRGFHSLLSLVPLAWGAAVGAALARRADPAPVIRRSGVRRSLRAVRTGAVAVIGVALAVLAVGWPDPRPPHRSPVPTASRWQGVSRS